MRNQRWFTPWLLVLPAVVWLLVFNLWPSVNTVVLSFTNAKPLGGGKFVGTDNFVRALDDDQLVDALLNSILYMLVCLPLLTFLPLLLAVLVQKKLPGITFFRTSFYTPVIASAVVVALIWTWLLEDRGLVNGFAQQLGLVDGPIGFLNDRWLLIFSAIGLTVWKGLGYYMIIYLSALGNVGRELYEAAAVDGAGPVRRFWSITVPGVRNTMLLISVLITVSALRVFSELYILTNGTGGPGGRDMSVVMLIQMYGRGFNGHLGYASALSILLFFITIGPMLLLLRLNRKGADA
ncbi:carbohydrate ABC transporter membrane protein 1, CUT1 family [Actinokineospora alba]|uniref:Carbohydrate ABC transporter membrane protein 1, CUT1 family n=1 Tax=Actinokineospora alba TaxID=504798 RepID=A0A1H0FYP3_9PSEU|nr:sugar ABC transporter permease [Actinokineospora alba]TDP69685.1 carbohydrate ABC transporter membrane protein 1 (CUT1 family) [Actinokineospora alba]SDI11231.1 multiple sugar transport system permease protein [Actinokineospora alba]SDN99767.1 carbohydrate ABC transporter membrane protein 1, CUT1 family [Actinokineospora alba]